MAAACATVAQCEQYVVLPGTDCPLHCTGNLCHSHSLTHSLTPHSLQVYHFGNTALFDWGPRSLEKLARKYRFALGYLIGRWGLPLARPVPLYMVSGVPIPVKKVAKGTPEFDQEVDRVHAQVVAALQDLYDRHKASYGWADRPLVIE